MSVPVRCYTVEYDAGNRERRRLDVWAASETQAESRAAQLVGGSKHRVIGRVQ